MENIIITAIIVILLVIGFNSTRKHFKGQGGCCGGGNTYVSKKKIKKVTAKKRLIVEGMMCENCKARVERYVNDIEGAVAKVNLKTKEVIVSMDREITDNEIISAIQKSGYDCKEIKSVL